MCERVYATAMSTISYVARTDSAGVTRRGSHGGARSGRSRKNVIPPALVSIVEKRNRRVSSGGSGRGGPLSPCVCGVAAAHGVAHLFTHRDAVFASFNLSRGTPNFIQNIAAVIVW